MNDFSTLKEKAAALSQQAADLAAQADSLQAASGHGSPFIYGFTIFVLACFVGYYVVWKVTPALHTPLMSVTNAISGIIIVGAMLQVVDINGQTLTVTSVLGAVGIFLASINIFGGFLVTQRMLDMFKKKK